MDNCMLKNAIIHLEDSATQIAALKAVKFFIL